MLYEFVVEGRISETVRAALPEMETTSSQAGVTAMFGAVRDQSDVFSILTRISDLGLTVVGMRRLS